ncbi:MAG: hypothetical protein Q9163_005008 [Psora crenata]
MDDSKVILYLKATNKCTSEAFERNKDWVIPARNACTLQAEEASSEVRIALTFDREPMDIERGYTFGREKGKCDILLAEDSISHMHFSIKFDQKGRIILEDFSGIGTCVTYNEQEAPSPRHRFVWILFLEYQPIDVIIKAGKKKVFSVRLELPTHMACQGKYEKNVATFLGESQNAGPQLGPLGIKDPVVDTVIPTNHPSAKSRPYYYRICKLGRGSFGVVYKAVDASTGSFFALKEFKNGDWSQEVRMLEHLSHEHIVRYVGYSDENKDKPQMIMHYYPQGNLKDYHEINPIASKECLEILVQGLKALIYLHGKDKAHRDIKPENILVQSSTPFHIVLADFGLARDYTKTMETVCGTLYYTAPEVKRGVPYTSAVDVWSLGVLVREYASKVSDTTGWSSSIIGFVNTHMLREDPLLRSSAKTSLDAALIEFHELLQEPNPENPSAELIENVNTPSVALEHSTIGEEFANSQQTLRPHTEDHKSTLKRVAEADDGPRKRQRSTIDNSQRPLPTSAVGEQLSKPNSSTAWNSSTQTILGNLTEDPSEYFTITVPPSAVSVRRADFYINVNHIQKAYRRSLAQHTTEIEWDSDVSSSSSHQDAVYVPFSTALELCDKYGLAELADGLVSMRRKWQEAAGEEVAES